VTRPHARLYVAVRTQDDEHGMALQRNLDGKNGEMCRLGFAGMEELREDGAGDRVTPRVVTGPWRLRTGARVIAVSCGPYHTLAVTESGEVYAFGMGMNGRLGTGGTEPQGVPTLVVALSKSGVSVGQPGRRMGMNAWTNVDEYPANGRGAGGEQQSQADAQAQAKLARVRGGGANGYLAASLPNRRRQATLAGKPGATAHTFAVTSSFENRHGSASPPPELDDDDIEAFTGEKQALRLARPRPTVVDDILGPATLGLPRV
jgi:hypothetical protein